MSVRKYRLNLQWFRAHISHMNIAERVVRAFGGTREASRLIGVPPSTVQSWKGAGLIPARQQARVLAAAREHSIPIGPADLIEAGAVLREPV